MSRLVVVLAILLSASCGDDDPITWRDSFVDAPPGDARAADAPVADAATPDAAAPDGPGRDASVLEQCVELRAKWTALLTPLGQSCDAPSDCAVVGERSVRSCEAYPQLPGGQLPGDCNGVAVNAAALQPIVDEVRALEQAFGQTCSNDRSLCGRPGILCLADCAPGATLTCIEHRCGLMPTNSCPPVP